MDYAVFKTGGKQYRVKPGDTLDVEKLPVGVAAVAEFGEVLAISDGGDVTIGTPYVPGAKVLAQVQAHYTDKKVMVFKYKAKTRYRRKRGPPPGLHPSPHSRHQGGQANCPAPQVPGAAQYRRKGGEQWRIRKQVEAPTTGAIATPSVWESNATAASEYPAGRY